MLRPNDQPAGSRLAPADITENTSFTHDGSLLASATWTGVINGSVAFAYDNNFRVSSEVIPAQAGIQVGFTYDKDGLLIGAGGLVINRDAGNGLVTGTNLGNVSDSWTYSGFGEPASYTASFNGTPLLSDQYARDNLGRIIQKTETIGGTTDTYTYAYDQSGRLTDFTKDGASIGHYEYDLNGNRLLYSGSLGIYNGTYDAQDRMLTYGGNAYTYTDNGELASKTTPTGITQYGYDNFGNLATVILPDGTRIDYVIDGRNRRVGKKVNGLLVQGFLYENQLRPVAELDENGNIISRFVYGTKVINCLIIVST